MVLASEIFNMRCHFYYLQVKMNHFPKYFDMISDVTIISYSYKRK